MEPPTHEVGRRGLADWGGGWVVWEIARAGWESRKRGKPLGLATPHGTREVFFRGKKLESHESGLGIRAYA